MQEWEIIGTGIAGKREKTFYTGCNRREKTFAKEAAEGSSVGLSDIMQLKHLHAECVPLANDVCSDREPASFANGQYLSNQLHHYLKSQSLTQMNRKSKSLTCSRTVLYLKDRTRSVTVIACCFVLCRC